MFGEANVKAENNLMAAVGVFFGSSIIVPLIIYFMFKEKFVRFHAIQALLLDVLMVVAIIALTILSVIVAVIAGPLGLLVLLLQLLVILIALVVWLYLLYSAFTGKATKLPVIGGMAESWA